MVEAVRENIFLFNYQVVSDNTNIGHIRLNWFAAKANLHINGKTYKVYPKPGQGIRWGIMPLGIYLLESDGIVVAQYQSTRHTGFISLPGVSMVSVEGKLIYAGKELALKTQSFRKGLFSVVQNSQEVGTLHVERAFLLRKLVADLPSNIPLEIQVFLLWVLLRSYKVAGEVGGS
ncbi:MAG: hypothetical protein ACLQM8_15695 [Limisphaerales bacterium]